MLQPEKLKTLSSSQLLQVKQSLTKFFYSDGIRINVALSSALKSRSAQKFNLDLKNALKKQILYVAEMDKLKKIYNSLEKAINKNLLLLLGALWLVLDEAMDGGKERMYSFLLWAGNKGGESGLDKMVPVGVFNLKDQLLKDALRERIDFLVETVDKTGMKAVARIIQDGLDQKLPAKEVVKFLREKAEAIASERADLITETETAYAMSLVEMETFKKNGIKKHHWVVQQDELTCGVCLDNEAVGDIEIGQEFPNGVEAPPAHVNCRCFLIPVLPITIEGKLWTGGE